MKRTLLTSFFLFVCFISWAQSFKQEQKRYPSYRSAVYNVEKKMQSLCEEKGFASGVPPLFIRILKEEEKLEVWGGASDMKLMVTYDFCYASGSLGPKRQQGDGQVPEGLYHIDRFNPASNFHLSLGLSYPNSSDRLRKTGRNTGGDIFIHGDCVSIGCVAITDAWIEELYYLCVEARNNGQSRIPIYIYPFRMSDNSIEKHKERYEEHISFWKELKPFYDAFESDKEVPSFTISPQGKYLFKKN